MTIQSCLSTDSNIRNEKAFNPRRPVENSNWTWRFDITPASTEISDPFQTLCRSHFEFSVVFLILKWTNESFHHTSLQQVQQLPTPTIPSDDEYYSATTIFDDKTPDQLSYQMQMLLSRLHWLSDGGNTPLFLQPSPDFTPLQNVCLYIKAFGINEKPLGAFQPLDTVKLARAFQAVWPFVDHTTISSQIQMWDRYLRYHLPIDCPQNNEVSKERSWDFKGLLWADINAKFYCNFE